MEVFVVYDDELLSKDFTDDIDVVSTNNSAKRLNRISKMNKDPKRDIICVEITTHDKLPDLLKTIDPDNPDNDADDNDEDGVDDDSSDGSSNDDSVNLPEYVYLVTPYEEEESDIHIDYEREIEVFVDEVDARVYAETRKRDPKFRNVLISIIKKKIYRDSEVKREYEKAKKEYTLKNIEVKKKLSSAAASSSSQSASSGSSSGSKTPANKTKTLEKEKEKKTKQ